MVQMLNDGPTGNGHFPAFRTSKKKISSSGSYLGKNFCGFLGNGCVGPGLAIALIVSQGLYASMVLEKNESIQ